MIELDTQVIKNRVKGQKIAISGNAAIARGLLEGGVKVITSYPGSPCAEVIEHLAPLCDEYDFYVEWSVNEKIAFEVAAAAAMSHVRSAFITKHVGMNVASDSLMSICYAGVNAGMVIVSADDPGAISSPIEEDTRFYASIAEIPGLEPYTQQEAKDMVVEALNISERAKLPVFIRATNRIFYGRGVVVTGEIQNSSRNGEFDRKNPRWFITRRNAVRQHKWLHEQRKLLDKIAQTSPFNNIEWAPWSRRGIITSGASYHYAKEAIKELSLVNEVSVLRIGHFNPLPVNYVKRFLVRLKEVLLVEELEPFIEEKTKALLPEINKKIKIYGKLTHHLPETGSYSVEIVKEAIAKLWKGKSDFNAAGHESRRKLDDLSHLLAKDPLTFCPGCPHRASFYVLKESIKKTNQEFIVNGDIGCYMFNRKSPFSFSDTVFCMGASIGIGCGLFQAKSNKRIVATIGDSTFLHAGIPALINCCYTGVDILVYILDNEITASTGLQPYAGIGINAEGKQTKRILIEDVVRACNVDFMRIIDPFNIKEAIATVSEGLQAKGQRVIISRHECAQVSAKRNKQMGQAIKKFKIETGKCKQCLICINTLNCPAIITRDGRVYIDAFVCSGCGLCAQSCPHDAIVPAAKNE